MARKYDIIERLKAKNEKPFVMIDDEHSFTINTSKTNVMAIMLVVDESEKKKDISVEDDVKMTEKVIELALGKNALDYIKGLDLTMGAYNLIVEAIIAGIGDEELKSENVDKKEKK